MNAQRMSGILFAAGVVLAGALILLQPVRKAAACEAVGEGQNALLAYNWNETEGVWSGNWVPVDRRAMDGRYTAHWSNGRERVDAQLQITIADRSVTVARTQPLGTCTYHGVIFADRWHVGGSYSCSWHRKLLRWNATIGTGRTPPPVPGC